MKRSHLMALAALGFLGAATVAHAQSPRVLNSFDSSNEGWFRNFGSAASIPGGINAVGGELQVNHLGQLTIGDVNSVAISDPFNNASTAAYAPGAGGIDLTGLDGIEIDFAYEGSDPTINIQFFAQVGTSSTFKSFGPDVAVPATAPGGALTTYQLLFSQTDMTPDQIARVRTYGINVRNHDNDALLRIGEVRSIGTPLDTRVFASFAPGSPDNGFNGMVANFDLPAIVGNNGTQTNSGLAVVAEPGTDGVLAFASTYVADENVLGGALTMGNGFSSGFNGRPVDLTNYAWIEVDLSIATADPAATTANLGLFVQTRNFAEFQGLDAQPLTLNAGFQTVRLSLASGQFLDDVSTIGLRFPKPAEGFDNQVLVDEIRALSAAANVNEWALFD